MQRMSTKLSSLVTVIQRAYCHLEADQRLARLVRGGLSGLMGRGVAMLLTLMTLPLTVRYLGVQQYGIWVTISTTVTMLSVLDLGIANTLTNHISRAYSLENKQMAQRYFATALWITLGISTIMAVIARYCWHWFNWRSVFKLNDTWLIQQTDISMAIFLGFFLLSLPLNLAGRVLGGYQEVPIANVFAIINSVLGCIAIVSVILLKGTLIQLTLAYCAAMLLGSIMLNVWLCACHKPWLLPRLSSIQVSIIRELFQEGFLFFIIQVSGLVAFNSDNLVISHYLGAGAVTPYNLAWKLAGFASLLQTLLIPSLWPAFTEAYLRRELQWVANTYDHLMKSTLVVVGASGLVVGIAGKTIIRVLAGQAAVPSYALLWCMGLWALLFAITVNQASLLVAVSKIKIQAISSLLAAGVNIVLSIILVQRIGVVGVLLGTISSYIVFIVIPQNWVVIRILRGQYLELGVSH
jgi:O-antigen/teichoic acid export membrane protein